MELSLKRLKRRIYMRAYRKRDYVKKRTHEYYLNRIIKLSLEDTARVKKFLNEMKEKNVNKFMGMPSFSFDYSKINESKK